MKYLILLLLISSCFSRTNNLEIYHKKMMNNQITITYPVTRWEIITNQQLAGRKAPKVIVTCKSEFTFDSQHIFNTNDSIKVIVGLRKTHTSLFGDPHFKEYLIQILEVK